MDRRGGNGRGYWALLERSPARGARRRTDFEGKELILGTDLDDWNAACDADAEMSPAEWARMADIARALDIEHEIAREEKAQAALYITYREAARRTGLSVGTIRERVKRDGIEVIGTRGTHRVRWGALREALQVRPPHHRESTGAATAVPRLIRRPTGRFKQKAQEMRRVA
jgi:hypothetical protein